MVETVPFWLDALRSLVLLVLGSALTLLGVSLTNRAAAKREQAAELARQRNAVSERNRQAVETVRELTFRLYVELRTWAEHGRQGNLRFDTATFQEAQLGRELIADPEVREKLKSAFYIARNAQAIERAGGPYDAGSIRTNAMYYATLILSAHLRGDPFNPEHLRFLVLQEQATDRALRVQTSRATRPVASP